MVTFSPAQVCNKIAIAGKGKCGLGWFNMLVRAFLAGAYIAMGAALATVGSTGVAATLGPGIAQFVLGVLFPLGLILVVLTGAELFTGDAMFAPMSLAQGYIKIGGLLKLWLLVFLGNLVGALFMAFLVSYGPYVSWSAVGTASLTAFGTHAIEIAIVKVSYVGGMGILSCFFKGVLCNWLVCLAIFLALAADDVISKIVAIWIPIMAFVATGFEHCVANMFFIPAGIITSVITCEGHFKLIDLVTTMWTNNLFWSTLGNIVGAVVLLVVIYHFSFKKECTACKV